MKVNVQVDTQTFVRFWLVVIGFALAALLIYRAQAGLMILGIALFLALALNEPVSRLANRLPGKSRVGSTAISYLIIIVFLGGFIFLAVPPIIQQTAKFVETVPGLIDNTTEDVAGIRDTIDRYNLQPQVDQALSSIQKSASGIASSAGSNLIESIGSFFSFLTGLLLVIVLSFLMLVEGPTWMRRMWNLYQNKKIMERHRALATRMHHVVSGYVVGQLTVSGIGATFSGLAVFALSFFFDVPANLAIPAAAITFTLSLIPMFGAIIGGVIITLLLSFNAVGAALVYLVFFIVYQQIENNFISPTIQSKRLELSPLAILAAVTVGLYLFGIIGGVISIPIAGCIKVLIDDYLHHAAAERRKSDSPLRKLTKKA